jgi:diketogulonate reductase-like aldo/keto reductase
MQLPGASFGTYTIKGEECQRDVIAALRAGFRGVDTASIYKNEEDVGRAIAACGVPREQIFLTTKLSPQETSRGPDGIVAALQQGLQRLQQPYVDCYMMHWPGIGKLNPADPANVVKREAAWLTMERLQSQGYCRHIAISNFSERHIASIQETCTFSSSQGGGGGARVLPLMNQMELHPLCRQESIVADCRARGILVQQYSPLAKGEPCLLQHPALLRIVQNIDVFQGSVARLCLLWGIAHGFRTVVRCSPQHVKENAELFARYGYLVTSSAGKGSACPVEEWEELRQAVAVVDAAMKAEEPADRHVCWFGEVVA